jgi:hypothetical protein
MGRRISHGSRRCWNCKNLRLISGCPLRALIGACEGGTHIADRRAGGPACVALNNVQIHPQPDFPRRPFVRVRGDQIESAGRSRTTANRHHSHRPPIRVATNPLIREKNTRLEFLPAALVPLWRNQRSAPIPFLFNNPCRPCRHGHQVPERVFPSPELR